MDLDVSHFRKPLDVQLKGKNITPRIARDCETVLEGVYCMIYFNFITEEEAGEFVTMLLNKINGLLDHGDSEDNHVALV